MVRRRRIGLIGCLMFGFALAASAPGVAEEALRANWHSDITSAWRQAKQLERPILIYVASNTCTYCRKMERGTLDDPNVQTQVRDRFVGVSINSSNQPQIARSLRVRAYPTTIVYGHNGKLLASRHGYLGPHEFQRLLKSIQAD